MTSAYRETLIGDVRRQYDEKTVLIGDLDPNGLTADEFSSDQNDLPEVTNMDIIQFLVYKESAYSQDELTNLKSLDACKYLYFNYTKIVLPF